MEHEVFHEELYKLGPSMLVMQKMITNTAGVDQM